MLRSYAVRTRDYVGAIYTVGCVWAISAEEAGKKARKQFGRNAWAEKEPALPYLAQSVKDLIEDKNCVDFDAAKKVVDNGEKNAEEK